MTGRVAMVLLERAQALGTGIGMPAADGAILLRNLKTPVEHGVAIWPPNGLVPASAEG